MKRFISLLFALVLAATAMAQTAEEIVNRMDEVMTKHENDALVMTVDVKIPIIGTMTTLAYSKGDKSRVEGQMMGQSIITWSDGKTEWTYNGAKNEIEITKAKASSSEESGDAEMFDGITDGYDVSIEKETNDAWYIVCKKQKNNPDKDAPKTMNLVVAKGTFFPKSLSAKMYGMTMTMRDLSFGFDEKLLDFHPEDYPDAKIIDKR